MKQLIYLLNFVLIFNCCIKQNSKLNIEKDESSNQDTSELITNSNDNVDDIVESLQASSFIFEDRLSEIAFQNTNTIKGSRELKEQDGVPYRYFGNRMINYEIIDKNKKYFEEGLLKSAYEPVTLEINFQDSVSTQKAFNDFRYKFSNHLLKDVEYVILKCGFILVNQGSKIIFIQINGCHDIKQFLQICNFIKENIESNNRIIFGRGYGIK